MGEQGEPIGHWSTDAYVRVVTVAVGMAVRRCLL